MDNNYIIKSICKSENIDLTNYYPITEDGEKSDREFDKRFLLDRVYQYDWFNYRKRIRFVKYPNYNCITLNISYLRISNILINPLNEHNTYFQGKLIDIPLRQIELPFKIRLIKEKRFDICFPKRGISREYYLKHPTLNIIIPFELFFYMLWDRPA